MKKRCRSENQWKSYDMHRLIQVEGWIWITNQVHN